MSLSRVSPNGKRTTLNRRWARLFRHIMEIARSVTDEGLRAIYEIAIGFKYPRALPAPERMWVYIAMGEPKVIGND